ncbi:RecA-like DNA recombinase [Arthrobacter phage Molivia]|uniref:RecA-like DNA recombinase n=1 Tax=Arthrobacter phage Molivia TaxID=2015839 RepID=A0A286S2D1_9CAUD|nr:RecA-like DNA recombinase [Arthrobacter phage Molivia]ASX99284.1 RecA-like DNA recombinase [Arthrobacter phage Molivia]
MAKFDLASVVDIGKPKQLDEAMVALFYGPKGVGKTSLAVSAKQVEHMNEVLLIAFEDGSSSVGASFPDLQVARPKDWDEALDLAEALVNEDHDVKTAIIDTAAEAQQFIYDWSIGQWGDTDGFKKWAMVYEQLMKVVKALAKSGINVLVLAHAERDKDKLQQVVKTMPYFQGNKTGLELPKIFDIVGYLDIDGEGSDATRVLQLAPSTLITAGNRSEGRLPDYMENPTMPKIIDALRNNEPKIIK